MCSRSSWHIGCIVANSRKLVLCTLDEPLSKSQRQHSALSVFGGRTSWSGARGSLKILSQSVKRYMHCTSSIHNRAALVSTELQIACDTYKTHQCSDALHADRVGSSICSHPRLYHHALPSQACNCTKEAVSQCIAMMAPLMQQLLHHARNMHPELPPCETTWMEPSDTVDVRVFHRAVSSGEA